MKIVVKKLWIKALRSGKYQQGQMELRPGDGTYCCLGVLCDLAIKAKQISPTAIDWFRGNPPPCVAEWAGLDLSAQDGLVDMNDGGCTFEQIALAIENGL